MKDKIQKFREYLDYIERHYDNVQKAWKLINDKCANKGFRWHWDDFLWHTIDQEVKSHDLSKLSAEEFTQYRQFFYPTANEDRNKRGFELAWEHHKEKNVHHWEHWTKIENAPFSEVYVVMMLVDWVAMGFEFGDTAKEYYEKNKDKIDLPEWAVELMYDIFEHIY